MQIRITNPVRLDTASLKHEHASGHEVIVQFSEPIYSKTILRELNELCEQFSCRFWLRFFGHYGKSFDCRTLSSIPAVRSLAVDCLTKADNVDEFCKLENIDELSIGVFELERNDIFASKNFKRLRSLRLDETRYRGIDLSPIAEFSYLSSLTISGHVKGIEKLGELHHLSSLCLRQISNRTSLEFVNAISNLVGLEIVLGGREDIKEVRHSGIKTLRIARVRGLETFQPSAFPALEKLEIQDQIRFQEISFSSESSSLARILILNCKRLSSLSGLRLLQRLREIRIGRTSLDIEDVLALGLPPSLQTFGFNTGNAKTNVSIRERLDACGYTESEINHLR